MKKCVFILLIVLVFGSFAAFGFQNKQDSNKFDERAIVVLGYLDWRQNATGAIKSPKVAFAIGDGTLLLTAAHCVDDFYAAPDEPISIDKAVISSYYGDIYDFKIVGIDKQTDVAILKAPWPAHPALKLANEDEFEAATKILIASRPQVNIGTSFHVGREIKTELLEILSKNDSNPHYDLRLIGAKYAAPGWSGSPMLVPDSGTVAGILTRGLVGIKEKLFGLITINSRNDAAGCNLQSIKALIKKRNLESEAFAPTPELENIPDSEHGFNLAMDFLDALLTKKESDSFQIATEFTKVRPNSVQAHLLLALSSAVLSKDTNLSEGEYLKYAETNYKTALMLNPNNAHAHAAYSGFLKMNHRNTEALEQSNLSLAIDPNNRMALFNKLMILGPTERKEVAEELLAIEPNNARVLYYYSFALSGIGENEKALETAQKAVEFDPNGLFEGALAQAFSNLHRLDEAEKYYKMMTEKCGCQSCWFKYADFLAEYRSNKLDEAAKALEKAKSLSRMHKVSVENVNLLELVLLEKTKPQQAENMANELLDVSPNNDHYWFVLAGILRTLKKYNHAVEAAQKAADLNPKGPYRPRLADCLAKAGELEKAEQIYDDLLKEFPDRYACWFWYAQFLIDHFDNRIGEAREALKKVSFKEDDTWYIPPEDIEKLQEKIKKKSVP